jgi:hypothetical protein
MGRFEYTVEIWSTLENLIEWVNDQMAKGAKPIGGITVDGNGNYMQALLTQPDPPDRIQPDGGAEG